MRYHPTRYLGVLNGPNFAPAGIQDRESVLTFESLDDAAYLLTLAYVGSNAFPGRATDLDGKHTAGDIPSGLGEGATLTLWKMDAPSVVRAYIREQWRKRADDPDPYPDYVLTVTERGAIKRERA